MTRQNRHYGHSNDGADEPQDFAAKNGATHGGQFSKAGGTGANVCNSRIAHGDPLGGNGSQNGRPRATPSLRIGELSHDDSRHCTF
jgi:hypothetical protein